MWITSRAPARGTPYKNFPARAARARTRARAKKKIVKKISPPVNRATEAAGSPARALASRRSFGRRLHRRKNLRPGTIASPGRPFCGPVSRHHETRFAALYHTASGTRVVESAERSPAHPEYSGFARTMPRGFVSRIASLYPQRYAAQCSPFPGHIVRSRGTHRGACRVISNRQTA